MFYDGTYTGTLSSIPSILCPALSSDGTPDRDSLARTACA